MKNLAICFFLMVILISISGCNTNAQNNLVLSPENHDKYYETGVNLITPYIKLADKSPEPNSKRDLLEGIKYLEAVTKINPNNFAAFWMKGKAYQALNESEKAYTQFQESYKLNKENPNVARELMFECLSLGKGKEGVEVALQALSLDKNNSGLTANLALAYLINSDLILAKETIKKAIELDSKDKINQNLSKIIDEVIAKKRKQPTKLGDLEQ